MDVAKTHSYHAETTSLVASLKLPLEAEITPQGYSQLPADGGYSAQQVEAYKLESLVSYSTARTEVSGQETIDPLTGIVQSWTTLATAVVENLNIRDIITADLVVAQIATVHTLDSYLPTVSIVGTRFENLRVSGKLTHIHIDPHFIGPRPHGRYSYVSDPDFQKRRARQHKLTNGHDFALPSGLRNYNQPDTPQEGQETAECSVVHKVEGLDSDHCHGHVIVVPHFGVVSLAKMRIEHRDPHPETAIPQTTLFNLSMVNANLDSTGEGTIRMAQAITNGGGKPVPPPPPPGF